MPSSGGVVRVKLAEARHETAEALEVNQGTRSRMSGGTLARGLAVLGIIRSRNACDSVAGPAKGQAQ